MREDSVLVVHCSDPRYQPHFQRFLRDDLGIPRYALLAIPGGVQPLTLVDYLPKFGWSGWRWLKFLDKIARPTRVVLLTHHDCRWYVENGFARAEVAPKTQRDDLRSVRRAVIDRFGPVQVDLYYATITDGVARFDKVSCE